MIIKTDIIDRQKSKFHEKRKLVFKENHKKKKLLQKIKDKLKRGK